MLAAFVVAFAGGAALAQETCESKAVGKDGKPLAGVAVGAAQKDRNAETFLGDDLVRRAFLASLFGFSGFLSLYSLWLLGRLAFFPGKISPRMMPRLDRTRRESLAFLRKFQGYAQKNGFANGRKPPDPNSNLTLVENHFRAHPAAYVDIGCCKPGVLWWTQAVQQIDPSRLLLGTGAPLYYHAGAWLSLQESEIGEAARRQIATENAAALFDFPDPGNADQGQQP